MAEFVELEVNIINGEVQEFPVMMVFRSDWLKPVGETIVRYFDDALCSVAKKTFMMSYGLETFGTSEFKTAADFWQFVLSETRLALVDGCNLLMDDMCVSL